MMGNGFAYAVIFIWPLLAIYLFRTQASQTAIVWTILGGFMLLPVGTQVDLPLVPPLGKDSIPVLATLGCCWFLLKRPVRYFSNRGIVKVLVLLTFVVPICTVFTNTDPIVAGIKFLPGLTAHDTISIIVNQLLFITPFFIGRQFYRTYNSQLLLFKILVLAGLIYSFFMLFEVRMSPHLHIWFYGYFPHSFLQQMRENGFRPVVFMGHGLWVAFFTFVVLIASVALWKNKIRTRGLSGAIVSPYMLIVLVLCKSMASLLYGLFASSLILMARPNIQLRCAQILMILALSYPLLSLFQIFPHQKLLEYAASISPERAQSLGFRFENEEILLEHGREKFLFGWGGWGRNRVINTETGEDESVTDGRWIITFGQFGFLGFLAEFGLMAISIHRAYQAAKHLDSKSELVMLSSHALIVSIIMLDQLPNASLMPWLWLIVGALLGRSEQIIFDKNTTTHKQVENRQ